MQLLKFRVLRGIIQAPLTRSRRPTTREEFKGRRVAAALRAAGSVGI